VTRLSVAIEPPYDLAIDQKHPSKIYGRARTHIVVQTHLERWCVGVYKSVDRVECRRCTKLPTVAEIDQLRAPYSAVP
jgi:hypothetical protein